MMVPSFQDSLFKLQTFWHDQGCLILQPYDTEKGAGTMSPHTFLRVLGDKPWQVAYVEPCRRPTDGRYGENPNRLQHYFQFQVILKPSVLAIQDIYIQSLGAMGIDIKDHDIRFVEDNWESPTLGAWGVGWEVWLDGMEVTQFTYFQQCGGMDCRPVSVELTYGLERLAMFTQHKETVFDIVWQYQQGQAITYGDLFLSSEKAHSHYNLELADTDRLWQLFDHYEAECQTTLDHGHVEPAYDYCLKSSHCFNLLDARGAISVSARMATILRIRTLANRCATLYVADT